MSSNTHPTKSSQLKSKKTPKPQNLKQEVLGKRVTRSKKMDAVSEEVEVVETIQPEKKVEVYKPNGEKTLLEIIKDPKSGIPAKSEIEKKVSIPHSN
jgi:hypothetical protein